jgi:hypothetical protein
MCQVKNFYIVLPMHASHFRSELFMQVHIETPDFDFLCELYQKNPPAYESLRLQILHDAIAAARVENRSALRQTLCRIESARQAAATPMEAVVAAARMMSESLLQLGDGWHQLQYEISGLQAIAVLERAKKP